MKIYPILLASLLLLSKAGLSAGNIKGDQQLSIWPDVQFIQDFSIRFFNADTSANLIKVFSDRNGYIQILSSKGLLRPRNGRFLYPGTLVRDNQDRQTADKIISGLGLYHNQFVYVDNRAVLSNAWAGKLYAHHGLGHASLLAGGRNFSFLVSDGQKLTLLRDSVCVWSGRLDRDNVLDIKFDESENVFWILGKESIYKMDTIQLRPEKRYSGSGMTCFELVPGKIVVGTGNGYFEIDRSSCKPVGQVIRRMPCPDITSVNLIGTSLWFGSSRGAMKLREDGKFDYYASERWLPSDKVVSIAAGPENSVLVLTDKGLGKICFTEMTLHDKAMFFEKQVRERHIRTGFNATVSGIVKGDVTTGSMEDSDNDGLWTSMYLAAETFRYAVTRSSEALQNVMESLDAMDRLYSINPVPGFPARSFLRRGYKYDDKPWRRAADPEWDWKSTTSSDEVIGHVFAFGAIADLVDKNEIRDQAVALIDTLMSHIIKNDFYLIDWDGKPTLWGKWNPDYVNSLHDSSGDRKLNSSNIIAMLQTAYHFTGKEKYRDAALMLMKDHHYLENLRIPMKVIGRAPAEASDWNKMLSGGWNHSDDEMYYVGYWGLYRYALNDTLKAYYRDAIIDHWKAERPEKEGLWNIMTAIADTRVIDLHDAVWYLQEFPLDLIDWSVSNSHRKDISLITPDFREQTTEEVLPPDELRVSRHNANRFDLDGNGGGREEMSAGDIWLLPYWIGRFLGVISGPVSSAGNDPALSQQNK
jgi:hypothetical protein